MYGILPKIISAAQWTWCCKGKGTQWVIKNGELHVSLRLIGLFHTEKIQFLTKFYRVGQKHAEKTWLSTWFFYYKLYQIFLWQLTLNVKMAFCKMDLYLEGYSDRECIHSCSSQDSWWQMIMKPKDYVFCSQKSRLVSTASRGAWRFSDWPLAASMRVVSYLQWMVWFPSGNC